MLLPAGGDSQTPGKGRRDESLIIWGMGLTGHLGPAQLPGGGRDWGCWAIKAAPSDRSASSTSSTPTATCGTPLHSPSLLPAGPSDRSVHKIGRTPLDLNQLPAENDPHEEHMESCEDARAVEGQSLGSFGPTFAHFTNEK